MDQNSKSAVCASGLHHEHVAPAGVAGLVSCSLHVPCSWGTLGQRGSDSGEELPASDLPTVQHAAAVSPPARVSMSHSALGLHAVVQAQHVALLNPNFACICHVPCVSQRCCFSENQKGWPGMPASRWFHPHIVATGEQASWITLLHSSYPCCNQATIPLIGSW